MSTENFKAMMVAMDKAMGNLGYKRIADDAYYTPAWCVRTLLQFWRPDCEVWEPAAGSRAISDEYERLTGGTVVSTDIRYPVSTDFLTTDETHSPAIITNPPYKHAESFVRHALSLVEPIEGCVAMLLRNEWDCAKSREDLWGVPFHMKVVLTRRPRWIENSTGSPRHNYAWYIWDWMETGPARIVHGSSD